MSVLIRSTEARKVGVCGGCCPVTTLPTRIAIAAGSRVRRLTLSTPFGRPAGPFWRYGGRILKRGRAPGGTSPALLSYEQTRGECMRRIILGGALALSMGVTAAAQDSEVRSRTEIKADD